MADFQDKTCSDAVYNSARATEFSLFNGMDTAQNVAIYVAGAAGYSGTVEIKENTGLTEATLQMTSLNPTTKTFVAAIVVPSC